MAAVSDAEILSRLERLYLRMRSDPCGRNERMGEIFVPGSGVVEGGRIVFVGEAPGRDEEKAGRPFVGAAGKNLNTMLGLAGLSREEVFITNVIKYRPFTADGGNRTPSSSETKSALPFLIEELEILSPRLVVCLGLCPARALLGTGPVMAEANGKMFRWHGHDLLVTYHPSPLNFNMPSKREAMAGVFERLGRVAGRA
ncbi:MAG: uracil-DNA glycosylase [Desulfobacteraceae bacterium]|nr:uracil-DNA glycosylase [Desulfobacteraceae bacterium]